MHRKRDYIGLHRAAIELMSEPVQWTWFDEIFLGHVEARP